MNCKKCGHELSDQDKFCSECGTKVEKDIIESTLSDAIDEALDQEELMLDQKDDDLNQEVVEGDVEEDANEDCISEKSEWYFVENNESKGAFTKNEMHDFLENGRIDETTFVWKEGFTDWKPLNETDLLNRTETIEEELEEASWYYVDTDSKQHGPYSEKEMQSFIQEKQINENTFVWTDGMEDWQQLKETKLNNGTVVYKVNQSNVNSSPSFDGIEHRNIPLYVVLCFVTCGLFGLYWLYCIASDVNRCLVDHGKSSGLQAGFVVLLTILTCGIYGIYFWYKVCSELSSISFEDGYQVADNSIICLVLAIIGLSIVSMCIVQDQLNGIREHA